MTIFVIVTYNILGIEEEEEDDEGKAVGTEFSSSGSGGYIYVNKYIIMLFFIIRFFLRLKNKQVN